MVFHPECIYDFFIDEDRHFLFFVTVGAQVLQLQRAAQTHISRVKATLLGCDRASACSYIRQAQHRLFGRPGADAATEQSELRRGGAASPTAAQAQPATLKD